jgi:hypothetical protein
MTCSVTRTVKLKELDLGEGRGGRREVLVTKKKRLRNQSFDLKGRVKKMGVRMARIGIREGSNEKKKIQ